MERKGKKYADGNTVWQLAHEEYIYIGLLFNMFSARLCFGLSQLDVSR